MNMHKLTASVTPVPKRVHQRIASASVSRDWNNQRQLMHIGRANATGTKITSVMKIRSNSECSIGAYPLTFACVSRPRIPRGRETQAIDFEVLPRRCQCHEIRQ